MVSLKLVTFGPTPASGAKFVHSELAQRSIWNANSFVASVLPGQADLTHRRAASRFAGSPGDVAGVERSP